MFDRTKRVEEEINEILHSLGKELQPEHKFCLQCGASADGKKPPPETRSPVATLLYEEARPMTKENRVERVRLSGGIIGALASSPRLALQNKLSEVNSKGWYVRQVIEDTTGNLFIAILRALILLLTFFIYTPANGYFLILERDVNQIICPRKEY